MPRLVVHLLGTPRLALDDQAIDLRSAKALALLSYLIVARQVQARDRLAAFLWPDYPDRNALASLRTALYEIRRAFGDAAGQFLQVDRHRVAFCAPPDAWIDVAVVERVDPDADDVAREDLQAAVAAYGGEFLDGISLPDSCEFDDWVAVERERFTQRHLCHLSRLAELHACQGDFQRAVELVRAVLAVDPLREDVYRQLMVYSVRAGQRAAALAAYQELVAILDRELGIAPLESTVRLYERIQAGEELEVLPMAPHPVARAAALVSAASREVLLRLRPSRLAGRQAELESLQDAWRATLSGRGGIVLVSGEAGVGKSALAAELAGRIGGEARLLVGRCHEATASQAYAPIIEALRSGIQVEDWAELGLPAAWRRLLARLVPELEPSLTDFEPASREAERDRDRLFEAIWAALVALSADRPVLFVVDDVHWADETSLALLSYLTPRLTASRCMLVLLFRSEELDTARRAALRSLAAYGRRLALAPLTHQETAELIGDLAESPDRPVAFARCIHRATGGNPFFIVEMLRAMVGQGTLQLDPGGWTTLAAADADEYACLPVPESVAALIDARLERLTADARLLAECASVLRRDFAFELVHRLSGLPTRAALDSLDCLLDQGLFRELRDRPGAEQARYDFVHSLVRDRVYQSLSGARRQYLHRQVAGLLETMPGVRPDRVAYHYLHGGVRDRAVQWSLRAGNAALSLFAGEAALAHFRTARELAVESTHERLALEGIGDAYVSLGRLREGILAFEQALRLPAEDGVRAGLERRLGRAYERQGEYDKALAAYRRAWQLLGGEWSLTALQVTDGLATVYVRLGKHTQATGLCLDALARLAEHPDLAERRQAEAWIQNTLGMAYLHGGEYERAEAALRRSLELKRALGDAQGEATLLNNLGALAYHRGDDEQARDYYEASLRIKEQIGDSYGRAIALTNLALAETHLGEHDRALQHLEAATEAVGIVGARWLMPEIHRVAAQRALAVGDAAAALAAAEAGLAAAEELGVPGFIGAAHRMLGVVKAVALGDMEAAGEHFATSMAVFEMLSDEHELAKTHAAYGEALHTCGDAAAAEPYLRRAALTFEESGAYGRRRRLEPLLGR